MWKRTPHGLDTGTAWVEGLDNFQARNGGAWLLGRGSGSWRQRLRLLGLETLVVMVVVVNLDAVAGKLVLDWKVEHIVSNC